MIAIDTAAVLAMVCEVSVILCTDT